MNEVILGRPANLGAILDLPECWLIASVSVKNLADAVAFLELTDDGRGMGSGSIVAGALDAHLGSPLTMIRVRCSTSTCYRTLPGWCAVIPLEFSPQKGEARIGINANDLNSGDFGKVFHMRCRKGLAESGVMSASRADPQRCP